MCPDLRYGSQGPLGGNSLVTEIDILEQRGTSIDVEGTKHLEEYVIYKK